MKAGIAFVAGLALALAVPVVAQTSGQVNQLATKLEQLLQYTGKVAARQLELEKKVEAERVRGNAMARFLRDYQCKYNILVEDVSLLSKATDSAPVIIDFVKSKNCALTGPAPEIPADLP